MQPSRAFEQRVVDLRARAHRVEQRRDLGTPASGRAQGLIGGEPAGLSLGLVEPRLAKLHADGDHLLLEAGREGGIALGLAQHGRMGRRFICHALQLLQAFHEFADAPGKPGALGGRPARIRLRSGALQIEQALLLAGHRGEPATGQVELDVQLAQTARSAAQLAAAPPFGADTLACLAEPLDRLGRRHPLAAVGQPLQCLLQPVGTLPWGFRCGEPQAVVAHPAGGAEHRLVDAEVEPAGDDGATRADLIGEVGPAELQDLDRLLTGVEAPGDPNPAAVVHLVGERDAVRTRHPRRPPSPVASLHRAALSARIDAVQRGADGPVKCRLSRLVVSDDHGHSGVEDDTDVAQPAEAGDLGAFQSHRSPTSAPASASSP